MSLRLAAPADPFDPDQFWDRVRASGECWVWTGSRNAAGYGVVSGLPFSDTLAHRLSWTMANGPIPGDLCVLHRCDNPPCIRPDHLFLGTRADNVADMRAKGRQAVPQPHSHCVHGHPFTPENTIRFGDGGQRCRTCARDRDRAYKARRRAA